MMRSFPISLFLFVSTMLWTGSCTKSDSAPQPDLPPPHIDTVDTTVGTSVITLAGDGGLPLLGLPAGIAVDAAGTLYVADANNDRIRKISPAGVMTTLAGMPVSAFADGDAAHARFNHPTGVAVDAAGMVYVADCRNHRIRKITPQGDVSTLAGSGIPWFTDDTGAQARFNAPTGIAVDAAGTIYVADADNHRIRKILPGGIVSTLAGSGVPGFADGADSVAQFNYPTGVAVDASGMVFVADANNHRIRKVTPAGAVSTLAGSGDQGFADNTGLLAKFNYPTALAVDVSGNVYVADNHNHRIRKITTAGGVSTVAGTGVAGFADGNDAVAQFNFPDGIAIDPTGAIYIGDQWNNRIRKIILHP